MSTDLSRCSQDQEVTQDNDLESGEIVSALVLYTSTALSTSTLGHCVLYILMCG